MQGFSTVHFVIAKLNLLKDLIALVLAFDLTHTIHDDLNKLLLLLLLALFL